MIPLISTTPIEPSLFERRTWLKAISLNVQSETGVGESAELIVDSPHPDPDVDLTLISLDCTVQCYRLPTPGPLPAYLSVQSYLRVENNIYDR